MNKNLADVPLKAYLQSRFEASEVPLKGRTPIYTKLNWHHLWGPMPNWNSVAAEQFSLQCAATVRIDNITIEILRYFSELDMGFPLVEMVWIWSTIVILSNERVAQVIFVFPDYDVRGRFMFTYV